MWTRQFASESNAKAHAGTADEIWTQCDGHVDAFVASLGTAGTLFGVGQRLRELRAEVKLVATVPTSYGQPAFDEPGINSGSLWER